MPTLLTRRTLLRAAMASLPLAGLYTMGCTRIGANTEALPPPDAKAALRALEASTGGRLGVTLLDSTGKPLVLYRAEEAFPLCSTAKLLMAAAVLYAGMADPHLLTRPIAIRKQDVLPYSPATEMQVGRSMELRHLCAVAMQHSDNTAANLIMRQVGGPAGVTAFARAMGDNTFRLDRWEPDLNTCLPRDPRDTSNPLAMAHSLHALTLGTQGTAGPGGFTTLLGPRQQEQLLAWLRGCSTGAERIAAGLPPGWQRGDKTGSGDYGTTNDVAIIWAAPPKENAADTGKSYILSVYFTQQEQTAPIRSDIVAQAARIALAGQV